jgi:sialidase-1
LLATLCVATDPLLPYLSPIFIAGSRGYACFRIPSAVRAPSGALLVFAEARAACEDNSPLNDVVLSRSVDSGTTWSGPAIVFPGFGRFDLRNPTAVFSSSGALLLQFVNATLEPWHTLQMVSQDEGVTWGPPEDPALGIADSFLPGPANGLLLSGTSPTPGRLIMCGTNYYDFTRAHTAPRGARVWFSDHANGDPGSWTSPPAFFAPNMSECAMAELGNGSVLVNFRNEKRLHCDCRSQARSDDGGVTWSPLAFVPDLIEPVCSAGLLELSRGRGLLFSNPASTAQRVNMTVHRSMDGGLTWPARVLIWPGGAAYSVLVPVGSSGGAAGVVFETLNATGYNSIVFALVPPFA